MVEEAYALDGAAGAGGAAGGGAGAWHTLQHAEQQQAALASALLGKLNTIIHIYFSVETKAFRVETGPEDAM